MSVDAPELDRDTARELLATMLRIRAFEEAVSVLKRADEVHGLVHLSIGQEATAAGVCGQLRDTDVVYSGHRAHAHALAKGAPLDGMLAELMGRAAGLCRGLGGSMHIVDREHGFFGATGVVGGNLPLALGSALAGRLRGRDDVAVVFFGDGAVQSGLFSETVNLAALWHAPIVFVCENNGFAEFTPRSAHTPVERVSDLVAPYGFPTATVDGSDLAEVYRTFGAFAAGARAGSGPYLIEALTHRLRGHYEGDPDQYRSAASSDEWQRKDPVARTRRFAVERGWLTDGEADAWAADARAAVDEAVRAARAGAPLDPARVGDVVYSGATR